MARCLQLNWQFMIVLKDKDLPSLWQEFEALQPVLPANRLTRTWGKPRPSCSWVNAIDYTFTQAGRTHLSLGRLPGDPGGGRPCGADRDQDGSPRLDFQPPPHAREPP
jgi:hypothetical protein